MPAHGSPVTPATPSTFEMRNDRSERLWGADGQKRLAEAHVVLLGATAVGCELLKNVILPGLGRFTVVDNATVTKADLGRNFFLPPESLGNNVAASAVETLKVLNPFAESHSFDMSPEEFINCGGNGFLFGDVDAEFKESDDPSEEDRSAMGYHRPSFHGTMIIVSTRVPLPSLVRLAIMMSARYIPVFYVACNGMLGYMRTSGPDMPVHDVAAVADESFFDPRIVYPFPDLKALYERLDPTDPKLDDYTFYHLPWMAVAYHAIKRWRKENNKSETDLPTGLAEQKQCKTFMQEWSKIRIGKAYDESFKAFLKKSLGQKKHAEHATAQKSQDAAAASSASASEDTATINEAEEIEKGVHSTSPDTFTDAQVNFYQVFSFRNRPAELTYCLEEAEKRASIKSSAFWVFMYGIKKFLEKHGHLPLSPSLPDFETTTGLFKDLSGLFSKYHEVEVDEIFNTCVDFLKSKGLTEAQITDKVHGKIHKKACAHIAANAWNAQFRHYPALEDELGNDYSNGYTFSSTQKVGDSDTRLHWKTQTNVGDASSVDFAEGWYTAIRASWEFQFKNGGKRAGDVVEDSDIKSNATTDEQALVEIAKNFWTMSKQSTADSAAPEMPENVAQQVKEMNRYGGSEMGHIASILGATASQEIIKHIQHKRVPVAPWLIFDGNTSKFIQVDCAH